MVAKPIEVQCMYQADGATVNELILDAFHLFVKQELLKMYPEQP